MEGKELSNQDLLVKCESFQDAIRTLVRGLPILSVSSKGNVIDIYNSTKDLVDIFESEILGDWYTINFGEFNHLSLKTAKEICKEYSDYFILCLKNKHPFEFGSIYRLAYKTKYDFHIIDISDNNILTNYFLIDLDEDLLDHFIEIPKKINL